MTDIPSASGNRREPAEQRYRVVLADDHQDVLNEVCRLLAPEFEVLGAVNDGAALILAVARLRPDAVICDIRMPRCDGIEAGAHIIREGLSKAVVLLSMYNEPHLIRKAREAGIQGYVLKTDAGEELSPAIYAALRGDHYLSRGARAKWKA